MPEISLTELIEAGRCYRKLQYTWFWKIQSREVNVPMRFGDCVHKGLGGLYDSRGNIDTAIGRFKLAQEARPFVDPKNLRTQSKGSELLKAYNEYIYRVQNWEDLRGEHEYRIECPFGFTLVCHPDREGKFNGQEAIKEWKTSERPWNFISNPNDQLVGYAWAKYKDTGILVKNIVLVLLGIFKTSVNGVMKTRRKAGEPDSELGERLVVDPDYVPIEEWQIENFERNLIWKLAVINDVMHLDEWPQETANCWNCEFKALCACSKEEREILRGNYFPREERLKI